MAIRRAEVKDIPEITDLLVQVCNVHAAVRPDIFVAGKTKYDAEALRAIIADDGKPIFVYTDESDKTRGYAFCVVENAIGNNLVTHKSVYIDDICVDKAHRKEGIGRALFNYVEAYAREIGAYNVTLNVWANNDAAIAFYASCGMFTRKTTLEKIL